MEKRIKNFEDYSVTNDGKIYSYKKGIKREIKVLIGNHGYNYAGFWKKGKNKTLLIHRLVAEAFIPNPNNYPCINHIDGDKFNNNDWNLEWCTYSQNNQHSIDYLNKKSPMLNKFGKDNHISKKVCQFTKDGIFIKEFDSMTQASIELKICLTSIGQCCKNPPSLKSCGGFKWKLKKDIIEISSIDEIKFN